MAAGVFACLHAWRTRRSLIYPLMAALCITLGVLSQSTTSLLVIASFIATDILGRLYSRGGAHRTLGVVGAVVGVAAIIFFFFNEAMFFEMLGKDPTLTGRTEIWPYAIANIYQRPLFGWGYFGFWTPANPAALSIAEAIAFEHNTWYVALLPNAHNTLIEALLEIGIVGTTLLVILMVRYVIAAMRCLDGPARHLGLSYFVLMSGLVILGYSEVMLLSPGTVTGLFFTVGMGCEKMRQYRHARYRHVLGTPPAPYAPRPARQTK
jgi:O-antigen ligase